MMKLFNKRYLFGGALVAFAAVLVLCISRCGDAPSRPVEEYPSARALLQHIVLYSHDLYSQDPAVNDAALLSVRYYDLLVRMEDLPQEERAWLEKHPEYQAAVQRVERAANQNSSK